MEKYFSIFQGILSTRGTYFNIYLDGLKNHNKFCASPESEGCVQHISSLLTKSETRSLGICLLELIIQDSPIEIFEKKANLWITSVLKAFNDHDMDVEAQLIFGVLDKILEKSLQSPDISKAFASTYLSKIYENLVNVSIQNAKYSLRCIETCLRIYSSSSGAYKGVIERFLWKTVGSIDEEVVKNCGRCLLLLQQIKGGGASGINHKAQWKTYQVQLIGEIHAVYNEMFANCTELYDDKIEIEMLPCDQISYDVEPVKKAAQLYTRCHNLIRYLELALREPFSTEKPILLKKILNIINRGLSVNCIMLEQNPIAENIALSLLLPKLHVDLLELLMTLMSILHGELRPYSEFILGLLVDTMKWTSAKNENGDQNILQKLRAKVYETLSRWCKICHSGNRVDTIAEYLFQQILKDVTPAKNEVILKVLGGARKHMSKKARRQLHNIHNENSNIFHSHSNDSNNRKIFSEELNQELCIWALRCLQNIILSSSNFVKPTILKSMQIHVTRICAMLCENTPKHSTYLYSNKNCRMEIYNALYAILMAPHALCPPPTEIAFAVLTTAFIRDSSPRVRTHCGFIIKNLEKFIHPQKESLLFTIDSRDVRNAFIKYGQENLINETAVQFTNEPINSEVENFATEDNNEANSKADSQKNGNREYCKTKHSDLLQNQSYSHDNQIDTIIAINDNPLECTNLINIIKPADEESDKNCEFSGEKATNKDLFLNPSVDLQTKSPEFVLRVNDVEEIIREEDVTGNAECIGEPISKKPKICEKIELNANNTLTEGFGIKYHEDEDTLVADIVSQFVDELN